MQARRPRRWRAKHKLLSGSATVYDSVALGWNGTAWSNASTPDTGAPFGAPASPAGGPVWAVGRSEQSSKARSTLILRR
jgi:hypothetical protein